MARRHERGSSVLVVALLAASLGFATSHARALEIAVEAHSGSCRAARVEATPRESSDETSRKPVSKREWTIPVPGTRSVDLDAALGWNVSAHCDGFWAPEVHLEPGSQPPAIRFSLVRTGRLGGRFDSPEKATEADELKVRLQPAGPGEALGWKVAQLSCPLDRGRFDCEVPAGKVDARLAIEGFAPHYAWGVKVPAGGSVDLGNLEVVPGASVAGWVRAIPGAEADAKGKEDAVVVTAEPAHEGTLPKSELRRLATRGDRAAADDRGFFQLTGLAPGTYQVSASLAGYSPRRVSPVVLRAGEETLLPDVVELEPLATLEVYLDPPQDTAGRPWQIRLLGDGDGPPVKKVIAHRPATAAGYWSQHGLAVGPYTLWVEDADGSIWSKTPVDVTPTLGPLNIQLDAVSVEGDVRMGDDPIEADVIFGTTTGVPSVRMKSDEEGRFHGVLPREGEWPLEVALEDGQPQALDPVEVERGGDGVAHVSLSLPNTQLRGQVVDVNGEPAAGVFVLAIREQAKAGPALRKAGVAHRRRREANLTTDRDGRFELKGLLPGPLLITAYDGDRSTRWQRVELKEDFETPPIRLVLQPPLTISGTVVSPDGPVPGASVVGFPQGPVTTLSLFAHDVTGADGSFTLKLTPGAQILDLLVVPPGYDVALRRTVVGQDRLVISVGRTGSRLALEGFRPGAVVSDGAAEVPFDSLLSTLFPLGRIDLKEKRPEIAGIEPGTYLACPSHERSGCASGFLAAGSELILRAPGSAPRKETP